MPTHRSALGLATAVLVATAGLTLLTTAPAATARAAPPPCHGQPVTIAATADDQVVHGTDEADVISTGGFDRVHVLAGGGDDLVCAPGGSDTHVSGDAGNDLVTSVQGTVHLGGGDDRAYGYGATVAGEAGDDRIELRMGGTALGGGGRDTLLAEVSTENEEVPESPLRLSGGTGNDVLSPVYTVGQGTVTCRYGCPHATLDAGRGVDTLRLNWRASVVDLAKGRVRVLSGRSTIAGFERVQGSRHRDVIRGDARSNHLDGNAGHDVLVGRGGHDTLIGGAGRDRAYGGPGRDRCSAERRSSC